MNFGNNCCGDDGLTLPFGNNCCGDDGLTLPFGNNCCGDDGLTLPFGPQGVQGTRGDGITNIEDNGNGTLTITYGDGSTVTTSDLTGTKGDKGDLGDKGDIGKDFFSTKSLTLSVNMSNEHTNYIPKSNNSILGDAGTIFNSYDTGAADGLPIGNANLNSGVFRIPVTGKYLVKISYEIHIHSNDEGAIESNNPNTDGDKFVNWFTVQDVLTNQNVQTFNTGVFAIGLQIVTNTPGGIASFELTPVKASSYLPLTPFSGKLSGSGFDIVHLETGSSLPLSDFIRTVVINNSELDIYGNVNSYIEAKIYLIEEG